MSASFWMICFMSFMRRCQDELVTPEKYAQYVSPSWRVVNCQFPGFAGGRKTPGFLTDDEVLGRCREIADVLATVEHMLGEENLGTFGHMITHAHALLGGNAGLLCPGAPAHARFILVDEFQDANFAQVKILQKLAGEEQNVFAVGDPDQAIFRFRGASSRRFGLFQHNFPQAKLVALEKNRRSTTPILRCAYALISRNPDIFPGGNAATLPYKRSPLISARDEIRSGKVRK